MINTTQLTKHFYPNDNSLSCGQTAIWRLGLIAGTGGVGHVFGKRGWEVINMTQYPEAYLSHEMGMAVVNISLITDYDSGVHAGAEAVNAHDVLSVFKENSEKIKKVVLDMIGKMPSDLSALGHRASLAYTRGDGHATSPNYIRLFEFLD